MSLLIRSHGQALVCYHKWKFIGVCQNTEPRILPSIYSTDSCALDSFCDKLAVIKSGSLSDEIDSTVLVLTKVLCFLCLFFAKFEGVYYLLEKWWNLILVFLQRGEIWHYSRLWLIYITYFSAFSIHILKLSFYLAFLGLNWHQNLRSD